MHSLMKTVFIYLKLFINFIKSKHLFMLPGISNQYNIYVLKESIPDLQKLLKPYIVPSILYKLNI